LRKQNDHLNLSIYPQSLTVNYTLYAGFVAQGLLSGAVCGNVFASPSVASILAAIRVCGGEPGVLLIVKNYTGDRLNFGMAMEIAKQEGIKCKMVIVEDDCALPVGKGITGGRGVAGTVFVHKIAGAAAAAGKSLDAVHAEAVEVAKSIGSLGIALTTCTIPGQAPSTRLSESSTLYEVGMGIHGEAGREQRVLVPNNAANTVADIMIEGILGNDATGLPCRLALQENDAVGVLLNNLGGLPVIETLIVVRQVIVNLKARGLRPIRVFNGPYMTSLEMAGCSLSLIRLTNDQYDWTAALDYPSAPGAWVASTPLESILSGPTSIPYNAEGPEADVGRRVYGGFNVGSGTIELLAGIATKIIELEPELTRLDEIW
jgi:triose/dihydroxyacetone kinase / FAD-AMP lyase (cyclizing)